MPRESVPGERRVALVPESVARLVRSGVEVQVQQGAGESAGFADAAYSDAGASVVADASSLYAAADVVTRYEQDVQPDGGRERDPLGG